MINQINNLIIWYLTKREERLQAKDQILRDKIQCLFLKKEKKCSKLLKLSPEQQAFRDRTLSPLKGKTLSEVFEDPNQQHTIELLAYQLTQLNCRLDSKKQKLLKECYSDMKMLEHKRKINRNKLNRVRIKKAELSLKRKRHEDRQEQKAKCF